MVQAFFGEDQEKAKKKLAEEDIPKFLGIIERMIIENKSEADWIYGNSVTYADLCLAVQADEILEKILAMGSTFPNVKKCVESVKSLPNIAKWLEKRPATEY